ncbi:MAG: glycosyltransferase family 4 protein, partial [Nitrospinota bacterium]|nr:glycosyltransferase family 4 protein [Nitrospinota bacterium]
VESLGLGKSVIFTGYSTNPALPLADLDVYVIPTDNETFGMSALEAMAMEAPVVGADNGGLPEVLDHGACGLLANPRDPASLAQAVIRYLSDEDLRKTMSRKGREKAQRLYDRVKSMDRLEKIYQDTLSES